MDDSEKPSLPPSLRNLAEQERRRLGSHPPVEDLVAYQAGELPADQEERLQEHLALCPECTRLFLDLRDFPSFTPPQGTPPLSDSDVAAAWDAFQARLEKPESGQEEPRRPALFPSSRKRVDTPAPRQERIQGPARWAAALAAVFFLSTVGLSFWNASLRREMTEMKGLPQTAVYDLREITRSEPEAQTLPVSGRRFVIVLLEEIATTSSYEVSAARTGAPGEPLWTGPALPSAGGEGLLIEIPQSLPPGGYRLTIRGGPDRELLGRFLLRLRGN